MFERFTERARQVVVLAQDEARGLGHHHIGGEHLLLGLVRENEGIAARVLRGAGIDEARLRRTVVECTGTGEGTTAGQMPFTPEAKQSLEQSLQQALALGHSFIGTEHVLLGVLRTDDAGVPAHVLAALGVERGSLADAVLSALAGDDERAAQWRHAQALPEAQLAEHAVPVLPSRDLHRTLAFYERLGFALRGSPIETYEYLIVLRGTIELHFYPDRDVDPLTTASSCYVRVRDADTLHAEWDAIGVPTETATGSRLMRPTDTPYGFREFALVDPDGNLLRVGSFKH
jgi:hypothetical protein